MNEAPILALDEVTREFQFGGGMLKRRFLRAVDHVSLQLRKGDVLGIVGESGSGKTTLSRMMLGLLAPTSGTVQLDGRPLHGFARRAVARRMQMVFQDPYSSLNPRHTIGRSIVQPLLVHRIGDAEAQRRSVDEMMDVVGLPLRLRDSYPAQLSGGQRQRVVIARALVLRPDVRSATNPPLRLIFPCRPRS